MTQEFEVRLKAAAAATDRLLNSLLAVSPQDSPGVSPRRLVEAMRHAVLGPGKRIRPFLLIESARLFDRDGGSVVGAAAALECVHAYSLVHDDLPAMDDDDMRRGRPTVHKAFDEATAILAGDALLTLAFEVLSALDEDPGRRVTLIGRLAHAAGSAGMVGGQMLDLGAATAGFDLPGLLLMQAMKTGRLLRFATEAGAILGGASDRARGLLATFGERLGHAFQLADDLIDATVGSEAAGKTTGKDARQGKATLVAVYGVEQARAILATMTAEAVAILEPFGPRANILAEAARFIAERRS
jgi:farnesyl diphosphate synthase